MLDDDAAAAATYCARRGMPCGWGGAGALEHPGGAGMGGRRCGRPGDKARGLVALRVCRLRPGLPSNSCFDHTRLALAPSEAPLLQAAGRSKRAAAWHACFWGRPSAAAARRHEARPAATVTVPVAQRAAASSCTFVKSACLSRWPTQIRRRCIPYTRPHHANRPLLCRHRQRLPQVHVLITHESRTVPATQAVEGGGSRACATHRTSQSPPACTQTQQPASCLQAHPQTLTHVIFPTSCRACILHAHRPTLLQWASQLLNRTSPNRQKHRRGASKAAPAWAVEAPEQDLARTVVAGRRRQRIRRGRC